MGHGRGEHAHLSLSRRQVRHPEDLVAEPQLELRSLGCCLGVRPTFRSGVHLQRIPRECRQSGNHEAVGQLLRNLFEAEYPPRLAPVYASLSPSRYQRKTRGRGGSLGLPRKALSSSTSCRFIPAHKHLDNAQVPGQTVETRNRLVSAVNLRIEVTR